MKIIYEPKIELTIDERCAVKDMLNLLEQTYQESKAPMGSDAKNLWDCIRDFCETYVADWEY